MTPDAFRALLVRQGHTQSSLARALRTDPRTVRRWALGEVQAPYAVQMLLEGNALTAPDKRKKPATRLRAAG